MAERQVLGDAVRVRRINLFALAKFAAATRRFALQKMAATGAGARNFTVGAYLKALCHRFPGFNAFRATHNQFTFRYKRARTIPFRLGERKGFFRRFFRFFRFAGTFGPGEDLRRRRNPHSPNVSPPNASDASFAANTEETGVPINFPVHPKADCPGAARNRRRPSGGNCATTTRETRRAVCKRPPHPAKLFGHSSLRNSPFIPTASSTGLLDGRGARLNFRIPARPAVNTVEMLPRPLLELVQFVNLFWFLHSYQLSSCSNDAPPRQLLHRHGSLYPALSPRLREREVLALHLVRHFHFEGLTIPNFAVRTESFLWVKS
jgi:hypothetical protein